jgi:hypothetical protein
MVLAAAGTVVGIGMWARARSERRVADEAAASPEVRSPVLQDLESESEPEGEEAPDPLLEKLLAEAWPVTAQAAALDAAAHALLVRERFEEAEPLVLRALSVSPHDAEATIHQAVLEGVTGHASSARAELERLAHGPAGWEASLFAAGFALRDKDDAAALRALRRFRKEAPPSELTPELLAEIAELERRMKK